MKKVKDAGASSGISGINITPIIDITLVLLIIMLVAAPVMNIPGSIEVQLPEAHTEEAKEKNISVTLGLDLRVAVDADEVSIERLPALLDRRLRGNSDYIVIVRADKAVPYSEVETLMELIKTKVPRAKRVAIATKQRPGTMMAPQ